MVSIDSKSQKVANSMRNVANTQNKKISASSGQSCIYGVSGMRLFITFLMPLAQMWSFNREYQFGAQITAVS